MKVLLIHNFYRQEGGENIYMRALHKALVNNKVEVVPFYVDSKKIRNNLLSQVAVAAKMWANPQIIRKLEMVINKHRFDLCHVFNLYPLLPNAIYKVIKNHDIPLVQSIQTYRLVCPKGFLFRNDSICQLCVKKNFRYPSVIFGCYHRSKMASLAFALTNTKRIVDCNIKIIDRFIFQARFVRDYHAQTLNIPQEKTVIIPHFVNPPSNYKIYKRSNFLFVGRLSEEKGIVWLLNIFKQIPNRKLVVIGGGPLEARLHHEFKQSNIIFLGEKSQKTIYRHMQKTQATIIPSGFFEVGPMVLFESYANGAPVIAPNTGVFGERITKKTGILYKSQSTKSLIKALNIIEQQKFDSSEIITTYNDKYSYKSHLNQLLRLYAEIKSKKTR